jgi:hypothetical protein
MVRTTHKTLCFTLALVAMAGTRSVSATEAAAHPASPQTVAWFQKEEQVMGDAIGNGNKTVWDAIMDPSCLFTSEEGEVIDKPTFLKELRAMPAGLSGQTKIRDLTVQEFDDTAIVRCVVDEWETVFGQKLSTKYRETDTFRRVGADWKLMGAHTSVVTADPPPQTVATGSWPSFVGTYKLLPNGWTYFVQLKDGKLYAGRDAAKLKPLIPIADNAFVLSGSLGDLVFGRNAQGRVDRIVELRKFEVLTWRRVK